MKAVVSRNDSFYAGQSAAYLVGPLDDLAEPSALRTRLQTIAAGGPGHRLGFRPSRGSRRWEYDPDCAGAVITSGSAVDMSDPAGALSGLLADGPAIPPATVHVHVEKPWLFLNFDHGLGGGRLFSEVIAAATGSGSGFAEPAPATGARNPGLRALAHTARTHPLRLLRSLDEPFRKTADVVHTGGFDEREALAYARSAPDFLERLRAVRDDRVPGAPLSALITSLFLNTLREHDIEPEDEVSVLVDLGRYLPEHAGTLSNFVGIVPITTAPPHPPEAIAAAINEYTHGCRALVRYGMGYAARLRARPASTPRWRTDSARARIVVTDHANSPAGRKISWAPSADGHYFVRKAPVRYANQISLAVNRVASQLHLTASYYAGTFAADTVEAVLAQVLEDDSASALGKPNLKVR